MVIQTISVRGLSVFFLFSFDTWPEKKTIIIHATQNEHVIIDFCERFFSRFGLTKNPWSQKWILFPAQTTNEQFLKFVTCTTLWHNCLMRNYTWQKCNCLGFHHHHHRPYWKRRIQNENLQYAHIGLSGLNGNACVDTFTCLFNALYLQTLYSLSTMPVRIRMWWMLTQGTCNFSQYDKTTHQKCHRLTYCMRWNFATCTQIMHFHVLFMQFPVRVRRRISSWAQWHTTYKAIVGARSDHRDWQEALAFRFWKREKEINKKTLMTKGSELKPYNFVKCSKKMSTVLQTDTLISERKENYSNSSVNFFFTLSIDKSPECIEFNW